MPDTNPNAVVEITHPSVHTSGSGLEPAQVTRESFDLVWKDKGWKLAHPATASATPNKEK